MQQNQTQSSTTDHQKLNINQPEEKINPQTLMPNNFHQPNHKNDEKIDHETEISPINPNTPARNKSQQKPAIYMQKQKHSLSLTHSPNNHNKRNLKNSDRIPEVEEESDHKNYQQLTMKLELVLNKISGSNKKMNKSVSQSENIIVRFEECQERKRKQIDKKKEEYEQKKCKQLKQKPTIDKKSDKISKQIGHKPIYLRVDALVQEKKKKFQRNEELKKKKEQQEELTYIEEYNKHVKKPDTVRTYDQYFSQMVRWKQKKQEENKQKFEIQKNKELEGITFQPSLNPKSKKMVSSHQRLPIEQRGLIKQKKIATQVSKIQQPKAPKKCITHQ